MYRFTEEKGKKGTHFVLSLGDVHFKAQPPGLVKIVDGYAEELRVDVERVRAVLCKEGPTRCGGGGVSSDKSQGGGRGGGDGHVWTLPGERREDSREYQVREEKRREESRE